MALLNSDNYGKLAGASSSVSIRAPGKFTSVFITGEPRPGQKMGTFQSMYDFDGGKYIVNNSEEIYFIPYFIKRYWEKYVKSSGRNGEFDKLVAFGWQDDVPKLDDQCKYSYIIAGLLLDPTTKKAITMPEDVANSDIKKGDPALIYFKCGGIKFQAAMTLIDTFNKKCKELKALSDNVDFERSVVTPRRFIVKTTVGVAQSQHGNKTTFTFEPVQMLPDKAVETVMTSAMGLLEDFEKQFDKTAFVKSGGSSSSGSATEPAKNNDTVAFDDPKGSSEESNNTGTEESFDLGI